MPLDRDLPAAKPLRLFVAFDVPGPVKDHLQELVAPFRTRVPGARWTGVDSWHVTVKFLGATWARLVDTVSAAVQAAAAATVPVETSLTELGVFPSQRRARVVWAGMADPQARFTEIVKLLDRSLSDYFIPEDRAFVPHLTLARLVPPRDISEFVPGMVGTPVGSEPFVVDHLTLYRSHLSPRGARYEALVRAPFGASDG